MTWRMLVRNQQTIWGWEAVVDCHWWMKVLRALRISQDRLCDDQIADAGGRRSHGELPGDWRTFREERTSYLLRRK